MKFIKKQFALWRIVLIIGVLAMAIPILARVRVTTNPVVNERQDYWASRIESRLNRRQQYIDSQSGGGDDDDDDGPPSKTSGNDDDDGGDDGDDMDDGGDDVDQGSEAQGDVVQRGRDYYRQRLERRW